MVELWLFSWTIAIEWDIAHPPIFLLFLQTIITSDILIQRLIQTWGCEIKGAAISRTTVNYFGFSFLPQIFKSIFCKLLTSLDGSEISFNADDP